MSALIQWTLSAGFWRFAGAVTLLCIVVQGVVASLYAIAAIVRAFRRPPPQEPSA